MYLKKRLTKVFLILFILFSFTEKVTDTMDDSDWEEIETN